MSSLPSAAASISAWSAYCGKQATGATFTVGIAGGAGHVGQLQLVTAHPAQVKLPDKVGKLQAVGGVPRFVIVAVAEKS